jgi:hypothetical protein
VDLISQAAATSGSSAIGHQLTQSDDERKKSMKSRETTRKPGQCWNVDRRTAKAVGLRPALAAVLGPLDFAQAAKKGYTHETDPIRLGTKRWKKAGWTTPRRTSTTRFQNEYQIAKAHFGQAEVLRLKGQYTVRSLYRLSVPKSLEKGGSDFAERPAGLGLRS